MCAKQVSAPERLQPFVPGRNLMFAGCLHAGRVMRLTAAKGVRIDAARVCGDY
ncbi:MAG: hypothetical protein RBS02_11270 [Steroidobacteraceae bacterium]|jgi:hypothetical protein|nr:hypothetical protein [Steroidobacteraceae bacterium]